MKVDDVINQIRDAIKTAIAEGVDDIGLAQTIGAVKSAIRNSSYDESMKVALIGIIDEALWGVVE